MLRHQYAGHATGAASSAKRPGSIIPPVRLGEAILGTGLSPLSPFLDRIAKELLPGVERVRDELTNRYKKVESYIKHEYPAKLQNSLMN